MTENIIPEFEKKIYLKLDFTNEICKILLKYNNDGVEYPYFLLNDVKTIFKSLGYPYKYGGENSHGLVLRAKNDLTFNLAFIIKNNSGIPYFNILKKNIFFGPKVTNLYSILNHLAFDENLLNPNFKINTLEDLKKYILDIIELCNKFTEEYVKEIEK